MSTDRKSPEPEVQGAKDHSPHDASTQASGVAASTPTGVEATTPSGDAHPSNRVKDPEDWSTGDETMTGAQASYLKTLCEEAGEAFDGGLSKAEASRRIDELQARTGRGRDH